MHDMARLAREVVCTVCPLHSYQLCDATEFCHIMFFSVTIFWEFLLQDGFSFGISASARIYTLWHVFCFVFHSDADGTAVCISHLLVLISMIPENKWQRYICATQIASWRSVISFFHSFYSVCTFHQVNCVWKLWWGCWDAFCLIFLWYFLILLH